MSIYAFDEVRQIYIKFTNAEQLIWHVLSKYKETRNDDKLLVIKVWETQGLKLTKEQKKFFMLPGFLSSETITRQRRSIQERGFFKADSLKQAQRSLLEMEYRNKYRKNKKKYDC
jgi:hypothetical protein